eukprot:gnl/Trimastix_PCT/4180.p1 GENE.gnl/Trimastix_PCT/4180~~gnl/Trimastix_PCT/4180.p1  ORF type:complete len:1060 (-),score=248.51 gnl/Trimastix_PCT/4180:118-3297(-)
MESGRLKGRHHLRKRPKEPEDEVPIKRERESSPSDESHSDFPESTTTTTSTYTTASDPRARLGEVVYDDDDGEVIMTDPKRVAQLLHQAGPAGTNQMDMQNDDEEETDEDLKDDPSLDEEERARRRDQRERKAFERRLLMKDQDGTETTKRGNEGSKRAADLQAISEQYESEEERIRRIKVLSRRWYLATREQKKIQELRDEIADDEEMFRGVQLTQAEIRDLEAKKQILRALEDRVDLGERHERYQIPHDVLDESGRINVERQREFEKRLRKYKEETTRTAKGEKRELNDNDAWQEAQLQRIGAKPSRDTQHTHKQLYTSDQSLQKEYSFVEEDVDELYEALFENANNFVSDAFLKKLANRERLVPGEDGTLDMRPHHLREEKKPKLSKRERQQRSIQETRLNLPIYASKEKLRRAVDANQVIIVEAETGSGKTTQIPQYLVEWGYSEGHKKVGITQPRRVAAMSVAKRVADEMAVNLGAEVGYSIRFEDCTSDKTIVKYMTDGMLLREFLSQPDLIDYSVIMLDEAHERTLHTDILFGLLKDVARYRSDLKLIISSATINTAKFAEYFDDAPIVSIEGSCHPVEVYYTKSPEMDYIEAAITTVLQIHVTQPPGDILVFLTGQEEIEQCCEALHQRTRGFGTRLGELIIRPIYASLPANLQAQIFEETPYGARKVVVATNIAETSLTIDGIVYVVDCGLIKIKSYSPKTGMEALLVAPESQANADQRKGRAGRVSAGYCFRLFTAHTYHNEFEDTAIPEIQRTNLGNVVLMLKSLGINDLVDFDFLDPPPAESLIRALDNLYALGALNDRGELTKLGRRMAEFPMDPALSKMLLASEPLGVSKEILTICAMLNVSSAVFYAPKDKQTEFNKQKQAFHHPGGDHLSLLTVYDQWEETDFNRNWAHDNFVQLRSLNRARDVRDQLANLCERVELEIKSDPENHEHIRKAITAGFFFQAARMTRNGVYKTLKHPTDVHIHPSSTLFKAEPKFVIYHESVLTTKEFLRTIIEIDPQWLTEVAPHYYKPRDIEDPQAKKMPRGQGRSSKQNQVERAFEQGAGA